MTKITIEDVKHVSYLARLKLNEQEVQKYTMQLEKILEYMDKLNEIDTKDVEPIFHMAYILRKSVNSIEMNIRNDIVKDSNKQESILKNAPERLNNFFKVEKII